MGDEPLTAASGRLPPPRTFARHALFAKLLRKLQKAC